MNFCSRCGGRLGQTPPVVCTACGYEHYLNARPTASLVIVDDAQRILLLKRARQPGQGLWEIPGGFCDGWEDPVDAARREGREELGVDVELGPFVGMYIGGYRFQGELFPVLDCFWLARLPYRAQIELDPVESEEARWFPLSDPPPLAFETMTRVIKEVSRKDR